MEPRDFCYWLQGKLEIDGEPKALTAEQVKIIQDHLDLVFKKVTPVKAPPEKSITDQMIDALRPKDKPKVTPIPKMPTQFPVPEEIPFPHPYGPGLPFPGHPRIPGRDNDYWRHRPSLPSQDLIC